MFSYQEYEQIINNIKASGKQMNFPAALSADEFVIMRHDVEFSVERAFDLASFEHKNDFNSVYFFQLSNNSYNLLSRKNLDMVEEIHSMGNDVGLHFRLNGLTDIDKIKTEIENEIEILNRKLSFKVDSFSFHRPTTDVLASDMRIEGIINAYQHEFFSFVQDMSVEIPDVKYLSDARHRWNYNLYPSEETICGNKKVQILVHPYSWTKEGYDNLNNFRSLIEEKKEVLLYTLDNECKHFGEIKNEL